MPRDNPNLRDLKFQKCPLCDKDIVDGRWHGCKPVLQSDEYMNKVKQIRLLWHPIFGWRCYGNFDRGYIGLSFSDVFNLTSRDENWESVGTWKNPKEVKNIH